MFVETKSQDVFEGLAVKDQRNIGSGTVNVGIGTMKNPLSFRVESLVGSLFLAGVALFFIAFLFIAVKNFNSDIDMETIQTANQFRRIKGISDFKKELIER